MNKRKITKAIIAAAVIGCATGYLLYEGLESSWAYYFSVDEFVESQFAEMSQKAAAKTSRIDDSPTIRLAGRVKKGSIVRGIEKTQLDFELAGQKSAIAVRYYGVMPKNFTDDKEVLVEGNVGAEGLFKATEILTRCESKYKARLNSKTGDDDEAG